MDADWLAVRGRLQCEVPNADLHKFKGRFDMVPAGARACEPRNASEQNATEAAEQAHQTEEAASRTCTRSRAAHT